MILSPTADDDELPYIHYHNHSSHYRVQDICLDFGPGHGHLSYHADHPVFSCLDLDPFVYLCKILKNRYMCREILDKLDSILERESCNIIVSG